MTSTRAVARYRAPVSISPFMRAYAASPLASFVIHSRWPCTVTPRGTTMPKSASQVVFVDGTITPMRLRTLMVRPLLCHNLRDPRHDGHRDSRRIQCYVRPPCGDDGGDRARTRATPRRRRGEVGLHGRRRQ